MRIEVNKDIVIDSEICHGKPTFKGTRIMISIILDMLRSGANVEEILKAYPSLTKKHIEAALGFATDITERSFELIPA
ncbi:MAG: DUF433 domain-containing protein [Nanoarchaeota archaeon]|nr:DUF433 domain-containing protein [Nanoarchaeota archaeon]